MKRPAPDGEDKPSKKRVVRPAEQELGAINHSRTNALHHLLKQKERLRNTTKYHHELQHQAPSTNTSGQIGHPNYSPLTQNHQYDATMNAWLNEWDTAPGDPLPSNIRPLSLLLEPAAIDPRDHKRTATNVSLVHYVPTLVPEGRAAQDRELEQLQDEIEEAWHNAQYEKILGERKKERQAVVEAARHAEVIDLTDDNILERKPLASIPRVVNMPIQMHWDSASETFVHRRTLLRKQPPQLYPPAFKPPQTFAPVPTATRKEPARTSWQEQLVV
jgi:hypothetical protein